MSYLCEEADERRLEQLGEGVKSGAGEKEAMRRRLVEGVEQVLAEVEESKSLADRLQEETVQLLQEHALWSHILEKLVRKVSLEEAEEDGGTPLSPVSMKSRFRSLPTAVERRMRAEGRKASKTESLLLEKNEIISNLMGDLTALQETLAQQHEKMMCLEEALLQESKLRFSSSALLYPNQALRHLSSPSLPQEIEAPAVASLRDREQRQSSCSCRHAELLAEVEDELSKALEAENVKEEREEAGSPVLRLVRLLGRTVRVLRRQVEYLTESLVNTLPLEGAAASSSWLKA
eukprot:323841-Hanusia_phi.AAC.1